jgi:hypothetical protein
MKTLVVTVLTAILTACAPLNSSGGATAKAWPIDDFCSRAQQLIASTPLVAENIIHADYQAFVLSKPVIRPLQTEQHHWYEDAAKTRLKMISCKMKTTDHLRTEYGADQAGSEGACANINRHSHRVALAEARSRGQRRLRFGNGEQVAFDVEELTTIGPEWLKAHEIAWQDAAGVLHVQSRAMRNDWLDPRYVKAPIPVRGTRYCHLIAPDYLRRLLTDEIEAPRSRGEAMSPAQMPPAT